jgi:hypothetical protein
MPPSTADRLLGGATAAQTVDREGRPARLEMKVLIILLIKVDGRCTRNYLCHTVTRSIPVHTAVCTQNYLMDHRYPLLNFAMRHRSPLPGIA